MKTIPLTKGYFTKVDDEDYERLAVFRWHTNTKKTPTGIVVRACRTIRVGGKRTSLYLARVVLPPPDGKYIDHINNDTLDNQKKNLRICTNAENSRNRGRRINNLSGYKGVSWSKVDRLWITRIYRDGKCVYYRSFRVKMDAVKAYNDNVEKYHEKFKKINGI